MIIYYGENTNLKIQVQQTLSILNCFLEMHDIKLKILLECLKNINFVIQETNDVENPSKLTKLLKEIKLNLDALRKNIFDLQGLKTTLENILSNISEETKSNDCSLEEKLEIYNKSVSNISSNFYSISLNIDNFALQYCKNSTFCIHSLTSKEENIENDSDASKIESTISDIDITDSKVLLISELQNKVVLPYTVSELKKILKNNSKYNNLQEIIEAEYTFSLSKYKNPTISRFKEAYNLMRIKEHSSIVDSLDLALELSFNNLLNPAIISACKNLDELDIYLDYLSSNELDKFTLFEIKYEMLPRIK